MAKKLVSALFWAWDKKIVRFGFVGTMCAGLHYGIFVTGYRILGFHCQVGNVLGFVVALGVNFLLNKYVTFGISRKPTRKEVWRFGLKKGLFYPASMAALHVLVEHAGFEPWVAQLMLIPLFGYLGYLWLGKFVFPKLNLRR